MSLRKQLHTQILPVINTEFGIELEKLEIQNTRKEFDGDYTLVVFPLVKQLRQKPEVLANSIGELLKEKVSVIESFNVIKGFLNFSLSDEFFSQFLIENYSDENYGKVTEYSSDTMVEYSSPNTNKPLHLGHIRNNLLGYSVAKILEAAGNNVKKVQVINDRGIHICKSMVAWQKFSDGETPESTGMKGDHFVGKYYVAFDKAYREEISKLEAEGLDNEEAKKKAPILLEAQQMLRNWEAGETEVVALWKKMNAWVYEGFGKTYKRLGVEFDQNQYESETYLLGKKIVEQGLEKGVFYKREDGSVWCDLTDEGLDEKIVLRADGTAVYITQDLGTAVQRYEKFPFERLVYTVGNEQDYHFQVLFLMLKKLGYPWAEKLYHLSYGMVDLPSGKMKSREGTVVDADDLMDEMFQTAENISKEAGKIEGLSDNEKNHLFETIGLGGLKYFILKVDPKKRIMFDPKETIDFQGNTASFIQYTHARIKSILRKASTEITKPNGLSVNEFEKDLILHLSDYSEVIQSAAKDLSPALIANYTYDLVKAYNRFYQNCPILNAKDENEVNQRLAFSFWTAHVIKSSMQLLGVEVPERM